MNTISSLHLFIDRHLAFIRDFVATARFDLAFSGMPFTDLAKALEETLFGLKEDPERNSKLLMVDGV